MHEKRELSHLSDTINDFNKALRTAGDGHMKFVARNADARVGFGIARLRVAVEAVSSSLFPRNTADITSIKWLSRRRLGITALVDSVFEAEDGRGWVTEIWVKRRDKYQLAVSRLRVGSVKPAYEALRQTRPRVESDRLRRDIVARESAALKGQFAAFRQAYNSGDHKAVTNLFAEGADAIPVFSFLQGRAQILGNKPAIGEKAERMTSGALVSNPARGAVEASQITGGEPKVVRFLNSRLAVVDGTATIGGIPQAHGYAPKELTGVYTDIWGKVGAEWKMSGSRAWF
jgi:hypothetical protein